MLEAFRASRAHLEATASAGSSTIEAAARAMVEWSAGSAPADGVEQLDAMAAALDRDAGP